MQFLQIPGRRSVVVESSGYTTTFAGTENPLSEGGLWRNGGTDTGGAYNDIRKSGGYAYAAAAVANDGTNFDDPIACLAGIAFSPNQRATATLYIADGYVLDGFNHEFEVHGRTKIGLPGQPSWIQTYEFSCVPGGSPFIARWRGPVNSFPAIISQEQLVGDASFISGDQVMIEVSGTTDVLISGYRIRGGVAVKICEGVDSDEDRLLDGSPGFGFYPWPAATLDAIGFTDFTPEDM